MRIDLYRLLLSVRRRVCMYNCICLYVRPTWKIACWLRNAPRSSSSVGNYKILTSSISTSISLPQLYPFLPQIMFCSSLLKSVSAFCYFFQVFQGGRRSFLLGHFVKDFTKETSFLSIFAPLLSLAPPPFEFLCTPLCTLILRIYKRKKVRS